MQYTKDAYNFDDLMGSKFTNMDLLEILFYFQKFTEAEKLPKAERVKIYNRLSKLEINEGE
jgi:hypothetical protein